jgi:hypothetical protein
MSRTIAFYHGMFPWLGIHLLEFDCDYRVEMLKQQITRTEGFVFYVAHTCDRARARNLMANAQALRLHGQKAYSQKYKDRA